MNKVIKPIMLLAIIGPAWFAGAETLSDLIASGGSLQVGDKVFDHFGWSSATISSASININTNGDGTANNLYGIDIQGGLSQTGSGTKTGTLTYSVHTVGNFLISDIHQFVNVSARGQYSVSVFEQVSPNQSGAPVVADSTVGLDSSAGSDVTDPPAELNDLLVLANPLQTIWVTKLITLSASNSLSFALVSDIQQRFSQTVVINEPKPPVCSVTPTSAEVCAGGSASFTVTASGGSPPYTTNWTGPNGFTSTSPTITFNPAQTNDSGTYTVVITDATPLSSAPCTVLLTVDPNPICSINPTDSNPVCPGSTNTYSGPNGMSSYSWSVSGDGTIDGATNAQSVIVIASNTCNSTFLLTLIVTDANNCSDTCFKMVSVKDSTLPSITCTTNAVFECDGSGNTDQISAWLASVSASDTCDGSATVTNDYKGLTAGCGRTGSATVTFTATDACGNTARCTNTVTVVDTTPPTINCPHDQIIECGTGWSFVMPTASDTCGTNRIDIASTETNTGCGNTFTAVRIWQATDACGNTARCTNTVTVVDTTPPTINCPHDQIVECGTGWSFVMPTASDTCGTNRIDIVSTETNTGCGSTFTAVRIWQATDACGNTARCTNTVTVVDTTPPTINCPHDQIVECGTGWSFVMPTASDTCGTNRIDIVSTETNAGCGNTFTAVRIWQATDACGNTARCTNTVTVVDTTPPTIKCPGAMTVCALNAPAPDPNSVTSSDACGAVTNSFVGDTYATNGCVVTVTRTYMATDACGHTNTCTQTITLSCLPITLTCPANSGQVGVPYNSALVASGGLPPYTFSIIAGMLPPGLTLNTATGAITGTPTDPGNFAFTAQVVDSTGRTNCGATANCTITMLGIGGCRVTGGSNQQTNSYQAPCITTPLPMNLSHGGQVGAPFSVGSPFSPNSPCISGEWQHNRHLQGNSLVGNLHASGDGNVHQFDSLLCACLPCEENTNGVGVVGGVCNPGDRICGPEPRRAPANKICFSGVGDYTFTVGNKTVKAVFRVDIEDRSEGNSPSSTQPPDRYRIRMWMLDPSCGRNPDPNSGEALALRYAASADPVKIGTLATTEDLKVNIPPDIDDGGYMTQGNHQIHPQTGAQCGALPSAATAAIDVATRVACAAPGSSCPFALTAQGFQGMQDPAFVYQITVTNSGAFSLTNISVIEMVNTNLADTTASYFAPGTSLPPGASVTRYHTNTYGQDTITTVAVSAGSAQVGVPVFAAGSAMASVGAAGVTCSLTLYSPCDLDGNTNDNHLQLPPGTNCLVRLAVQVCNSGQADLTGVTVNDNWLNYAWPTFDLPKGACTNISCTITQSCPALPITPQVTAMAKVKPDCSHGAYGLGGANISVNSSCNGRVEVCPLSVGLTKTDISCFGGSNGTVTATFSGGTAPFTISIDGAAFAAAASPKSFTGLKLGAHTVTVKDAMSASVPQSATLTQPASALSCSASPASATNCSGNSQSFTVTPAGGTAPYTIAWSGPGMFTSNAATINVSAGGTYVATVTDARLCTKTCQAVLTVKVAPIVGVNSVVICAGASATLTCTNNVGKGAKYLWSNGATTSSITVTPTGTTNYTVTVTSTTGCSSSAVSIVTVNPLPNYTLTSATTVNAGTTANIASVAYAGAGAAYVWGISNGTITGGQGTTNVAWTAGTNTNSLIVITLKVTTPAGCQASCSKSITNKTGPMGFTTFTQSVWGTPPNGANATSVLTNVFPKVYTNGFAIGGTYTIKLTNALAIISYLPDTGAPAVLGTNYVNPFATGSGALGAEVTALKLNADASTKAYTKTGLANLKVAPGNKLAGQTVAQVLTLANTVLGGNTAALPTGVSLADLFSVLVNINGNFDSGTTNKGFLVF